MAFQETEFPRSISYKAMGGPGFNTTVNEGFSGFEQRNQNWSTARGKLTVSLMTPTLANSGASSLQAYLDQLQAFFYVMGGMANGFRLRDHKDYSSGINGAQAIGIGDGVTSIFQLIKTYSAGGGSYVRSIIKPVTSQVKNYLNQLLTDTVEVYLGGVAQAFNSGYVGGSPARYTLDHTTGQVNFGAYSKFSITSVTVSGTTATYFYTLLTGTAPAVNQQVIIDDPSYAGNEGNFIVTAATSGQFSITNAAAVPQGAAGTGFIYASNLTITAAVNVSGNTWRYTYSLVSGQTVTVGMRVTISGMQNAGNNTTLYITSLAGGAGTFDAVNASGHAESASSGNGLTDWVPATGAVVSSAYEFDFPVRFDTDNLDIQVEDSDILGGAPIVSWNSIVIRELRMASGTQG